MKRSKHSLSHYKLATMDMGELVPVMCLEALPGDTFQHQVSALIRVSPLVAPVMHPVSVRFHTWFVPNRLVWPVTTGSDGWENFITGGKDGNDQQQVPTISTGAGGVAEGSLLDYLGVPTGAQNLAVNALPVRCYNLIFNEFYRDQDLAAERVTDDVSLANIAWQKDYFTSSRPFTQKGPAVTIPIGDQAPVRGVGTDVGSFEVTAGTMKETGGIDTPISSGTGNRWTIASDS